MAEQVADIFTEVIVAPDVRRRGARDPSRQEEPAPARSCPTRRRRRGSRCAPSRAACCCRTPTGSTPTGRRPATWTLVVRRAPPTRRPARSRLRLAGVPRGEVATPSCSPRTAPPSASAWARSTGSTPAGSPSTAPATIGARVGRGIRRVLPVRRRPRGADRRRASGRSSSPAARCATTRSSTPRRPPASRCTSPASATSSTESALPQRRPAHRQLVLRCCSD